MRHRHKHFRSVARDLFPAVIVFVENDGFLKAVFNQRIPAKWVPVIGG
ncbi:MAG: hypothetical protein GY758_32870 [Fuerstiella sp.]|nr:hypothetical protein [Fuerstiella sp.]MCP4783710.1 hypothetical protein [Fuerstiella sp.]MCP4857055.1 hypothetical protein [Fuerstiella sp.]